MERALGDPDFIGYNQNICGNCATATGIEKYHKGCNLVILMYCEQLSMQQIITVSACSLGTVVSWGISGGKDEQ